VTSTADAQIQGVAWEIEPRPSGVVVAG